MYFPESENQKLRSITRFVLSLYSAQVSKKTIIPSIPMIHEGQKWKKKSQKGSWESKGQSLFCTGANFRPVRIFAQWCKIFAPFWEVLDFSAFYALLSFLILICNVDFDSNSSCLDRFNKFGINSLQKL